MKQKGRFKENQAKFYFAEVVLALGYLHDREVLYRDLKPENVLLDAEGHVCLTDFSISREGVSNICIRRSFCGSPEYMPPEMLRGAGYTRALDFYSLGAFLYEMLAGIPPFFHTNRTRMFRSIQQEELRFPSYFSPNACSLISRLMEKNPGLRLGSKSGIKEIQGHPWCHGINWAKVREKEYQPPIQPNLRASNFDAEYTSQKVDYPEEEAVTEPSVSMWYERVQQQFQGFEYPKSENVESSYTWTNQVPSGKLRKNDLGELPISTPSTKSMRRSLEWAPEIRVKKPWTDELSLRSSLIYDCHSAGLAFTPSSPTHFRGPSAVSIRPEAKDFAMQSPRDWSESLA